MFVTRGRALIAAAVVAAVTGTALPFVDPPIYVGGGGNPVVTVVHGGGTNTAHLWMSAAGTTTCVRDAAAVIYTTALTDNAVCALAQNQRAYTQANLGDTIYVEGAAAVTSQWKFPSSIKKTVANGTCNYNYGGTADYSQCETFMPAPDGSSLQFTVPQSGYVGTAQIFVCVSGLSIQNATINMVTFTEASTGDTLSGNSIGVGASDNGCGTTNLPHDDYFANNNYGGQVNTGLVTNTWFVGGTATGTADIPWQVGGDSSVAVNTWTSASGIVGVTFQGFNFANHSFPTHHMICVIMRGTDGFTFAGDQFQDCPVYAFEDGVIPAGVPSSYHTQNMLFENNYFVRSIQPTFVAFVLFEIQGTPNQTNNNIFRFNSFAGGAGFQFDNKCAVNVATCTGSMDNNQVYGNVAPGCPTWSVGSQGGLTGTGWTQQSYNIQPGSKANFCSGDTTSSFNDNTISYASIPAYNLDLNGAQTANNFVPNTVTWPLTGRNIHSSPRSGASTNAGAD